MWVVPGDLEGLPTAMEQAPQPSTRVTLRSRCVNDERRAMGRSSSAPKRAYRRRAAADQVAGTGWRHSQAAPRTPEASPCRLGSRRVRTGSCSPPVKIHGVHNAGTVR